MSIQVELSFVIPLYNEDECFDVLIERMKSTMDSAEFPCEVILVDDGSSDKTRDKIESICSVDHRFRALLLSRNFGHQRAVSAGLDHVRGRYVGILDGDLQDPPEILLEFHKTIQQGYDLVYAVRKQRKENLINRCCYWTFYRLLRFIANIDIPLDSGDFCLISERVVREIQAMPEHHRFLRGMRCWVGFRQIGIPYAREKRVAGKSKYSLSKLFLLATDGLLTFSEAPLRLATLVGLIVATFSFLWALYVVGWRLFDGNSELPGFATIACGMFFLGGIQLICLGILGEYIARIHNEVKGRPVYIVDRRIGFEDEQQVVQ
jgi:dolichol-phosphate mannosyltransferase